MTGRPYSSPQQNRRGQYTKNDAQHNLRRSKQRFDKILQLRQMSKTSIIHSHKNRDK